MPYILVVLCSGGDSDSAELLFFFFSSRRRHTRYWRDWSSDVCSSDLQEPDGSSAWRRSPGGLVTAVEPVMRDRGGAWVGWDGGPDGTDEPLDEDGMRLVDRKRVV